MAIYTQFQTKIKSITDDNGKTLEAYLNNDKSNENLLVNGHLRISTEDNLACLWDIISDSNNTAFIKYNDEETGMGRVCIQNFTGETALLYQTIKENNVAHLIGKTVTVSANILLTNSQYGRVCIRLGYGSTVDNFTEIESKEIDCSYLEGVETVISLTAQIPTQAKENNIYVVIGSYDHQREGVEEVTYLNPESILQIDYVKMEYGTIPTYCKPISYIMENFLVQLHQ